MWKKMNKTITVKQVLSLLAVFLLYSFEPIVAKITSQQSIDSFSFWLGLGLILVVLGLYAILWQQILKSTPLSTAYMFRGSTLIYVLLLSALILGDSITLFNCIGAAMIIIGIVLFAKET